MRLSAAAGAANFPGELGGIGRPVLQLHFVSRWPSTGSLARRERKSSLGSA